MIVGLVGVLLLVGVSGGLWWRSHTAWREVVPRELPTMPEAVALRVEELVGKIWRGEGDVATVGELAMVYHANGFSAEAERAYRVLGERDPAEPRWPYLLSELLGTAGRLTEAEPSLRRVTELAPGRAVPRVKLANLLFKSGRLVEAGEAYAAVVETDPKNPHARLGLARVAVEDGRWLEARRELETLVAITPSFSGGLSLLATVDDVLGETQRAAEMRRRAEAAGRFREARDPWDEALLQYCLTSYGLRVAAAASDDDAWSRQLLARATELEPAIVANWQQWGRALQQAGDLIGAAEKFTQASALDPGDAQVWIDRVGVARANRDLEQVMAMAKAGLARCPNDAGLNYEWGRSLVQAGRLREAVAPFERAVELDGYNQTAAVELVALWFRLEEEGKAEAVLRSALERTPDFAPLLEFLVRFHVRAGREADAREALERLAKAPNHEAPLANARKEFTARFGQAGR